MNELVGLIPASGKGTRAYPHTKKIPKGMLKIGSKPILEHLVEIQRDQLGIRRIFIVVGSLGDIIREYFGDGSRFGVQIEYLQNDAVDLGLAYSVSMGEQYIDQPFLLMLSDEYYQDSDHFRLTKLPCEGEAAFVADKKPPASAGANPGAGAARSAEEELETGTDAVDFQNTLGYCALMRTQDWKSISRNYTVRIEGDRIVRLIEKPTSGDRGLLGTGTFILSPRIFGYLKKALAEKKRAVDFIGVLDDAVQKGEKLHPFFIQGSYVNVNDVDSLNWANYLRRSRKLPSASLSVIIQSLGVEEGLSLMASEFNDQTRVSEVLVVVPSGTKKPEWVSTLGKTRWLEAPPGSAEYGSMISYGLEQAHGDLLAVVEGYYSFYPSDLSKFLSYIADADLVLGTRTTRQLIQQGSRMRGRVWLAHVFLGKLVELCWIRHRIRLTDVGCTYRVLWRNSYIDIRDRLRSAGPEYVLEMDIEMLRSRKRLIEVPVSFLNPNEVLAERHQNVSVFLRMLKTIVRKRLGLN